ncbi:MAG: hypothetical protein C0601_11545 [Candidatus Muiribacterium halophilum]|uniref:Type II secretion system protein J n=1 Tax=Muiribacterium halophilum TaxID=2053465 RepID=A0A2N5ZBE0_MUIH1|nr:MAG: hypothetical protein C0601_11545 [Candidatus Muirbacterium halophilum]
MTHKRKGFTFIEIMIATAILAIFGVYVAHTFIGGTRAYRKEVENFNILDRARFTFIKFKNDLRDANEVVFPIDDGEVHEKLVIVKHLIDYTKKPEENPYSDAEPLYYKNITISYSLEDEPYENDLKRLIRTIKNDTSEIETVIAENIKDIAFIRNKLKKTRDNDYLIPEDNGISPDNVYIWIKFKAYQKDQLGDLSDDQYDEQLGYELEMSSYVKTRGAFLGGDIE